MNRKRRQAPRFAVGEPVKIVNERIFADYWAVIQSQSFTQPTGVSLPSRNTPTGWSYWVLLDHDPPDFLVWPDTPPEKCRRFFMPEGNLEPLNLLEKLAWAAQ